jgi:trimeric autotransporter adhesin
MNPLIRIKTTPPLLITLTLLCFGLSPKAEAVVPPPDGGYPGGNTAEGQAALLSLTTGGFNTAVGYLSLRSDTTGQLNTALGAGTLLANNGTENTAIGIGALLSNTTANFNTAIGAFALVNNNASIAYNTAIGAHALESNATGFRNTAVGTFSMQNNVSGFENTAIGDNAGHNVTGSGNVSIGAGVATVGGEDNHTYIRNINTTTVAGGGTDYVTVDLGSGLLGHLSSSRRYKEEIKPIGTASEALYQLKPVTYRYKKEVDRTQTPAFGLVAEEVAQVNPHLVAHNAQGQPESVHYEMVNAMLLNEFLKEHKIVQEQGATMTQQRKDFEAAIAQQQKQIDALTAGLQKVSAQLELSKHAPQTVKNTD